MSFWVQHGYGKSDKLDALSNQGLLTGAILSPADEDNASLQTTNVELRASGIETLIDPQLYVHTIPEGVARCHEAHGLDFGELNWFLAPSDIEAHVRAVRDANSVIDTPAIIAPSPYQATFGDVWTPLSLQYARSMLEVADRPVYLSIVAEDVAFADWEQTQAYLDALTTLDVQGIYLIVSHSGQSYPLTWQTDRLLGVLRVIYTLAEYNRYEVVWGYADLAGLAGLAAGASGAATGWYHSLRLWTPNKWIPQSGGRQANPRVFVRSLLSPLEAAGEAVSAARTSIATRVFPDECMREHFQNDGAWGITDSRLQHLIAMAELFSEVDRRASARERVDSVLAELTDGLTRLSETEDAGAALSPSHRSGLEAIRDGLIAFAEAEDL